MVIADIIVPYQIGLRGLGVGVVRDILTRPFIPQSGPWDDGIFFSVEPRDEVTLVQISAAYSFGLGRRGFHPTDGEKRGLGKCFMHTLLAQG